MAMPMSARLERGRVVDAVAGHRDDLAQGPQRVGDAQLRFGGVAGEDDLAVLGEDAVELRVAHRVELGPGDHEVGVDADPPGDGLRGEAVVAGDDHDPDAGLMAAGDRVGHLGAARRAG